MNEGAVAFIDCLGWKGIWRRTSAQLVIDRIKAIKTIAEDEARKFTTSFNLMFGNMRIHQTFISDTVAIGVDVEKKSELSHAARGMLILTVAAIAQRVSAHLILGTPPLSVRGSVFYGQFEIQDSIVIGEAIDQVASTHELADGAFIWIPPELDKSVEAFWAYSAQNISALDEKSVFERYEQFIEDGKNYGPEFAFFKELAKTEPAKYKKWLIWSASAGFLRYSVPIKSQGPVACIVPNPIIGSLKNPSVMIQQYRIAMESKDPAVETKKENTLRFLEYSVNDFNIKLGLLREAILPGVLYR